MILMIYAILMLFASTVALWTVYVEVSLMGYEPIADSIAIWKRTIINNLGYKELT